MRSWWIHDFEHLTFFGTAALFWWPIINPAPRARGRRGGLYYGIRIAYLIVATAQNTLLGAILSLTERVLYPSYALGAERLGMTALEDQALGGGIMWSGGHMYLVAILVLAARVWRGWRAFTPLLNVITIPLGAVAYSLAGNLDGAWWIVNAAASALLGYAVMSYATAPQVRDDFALAASA